MANKDIVKNTKKENHRYLQAFNDMENRIENMLHKLWHNPLHHDNASDFTFPLTFSSWPKVDVIDRDKEVLVKAELPGIDKKDIDITLSNNRLVIKAQTCHENKEEKGDYLKQEISKSEIYRSVVLPGDVDDEKVKTSFKNGVLEITMPKKESSHRRKIEVN